MRNAIWGVIEPWLQCVSRAPESNWPDMSLMKSRPVGILIFPTGLFVSDKTFPPIERNSLQLPSKTGYFQTGFNNLAA